jgi:hypothetical protein
LTSGTRPVDRDVDEASLLADRPSNWPAHLDIAFVDAAAELTVTLLCPT